MFDMRKLQAAFLLLMLFVSSRAGAQSQATSEAPTSLFSFVLSPFVSMPLGENSPSRSLGGGGTLFGKFRLPFYPLVFVGGSLGTSVIPLYGAPSLSLVEAGLGAGMQFDFLPDLSLQYHLTAGSSRGLDSSGSGWTGFFGAQADLFFLFSSSFNLGFGAVFRSFGSYSDLCVTLDLAYNFPYAGPPKPGPPAEKTQPAAKPEPIKASPQLSAEPKGVGVVFKEVSLGAIYPFLHAFYDLNPIGTIVLRNTEDTTATRVSVALMVRQYMDAPKECAIIDELLPGEQKSVNLFALFKNSIFEVKQSTKVSAEISLSYSLKGKPVTVSKVESLRILDRNAMSWDDTNKAAAFVMPKEPAVLMLSNQVNSYVRDSLNKVIDRNLQTAMAIHDTLRLLGLAYVSPPLTSYAVCSQDKTAVDSVKFPLETLQYRSGDCSDLSILYSSLLESVQIETAFITIPGHIFLAFALGSSEEEVRKTFTKTDEFIFRGGKVWVPLEVTDREGPFLAAWQTGAREWRENLLKKQAELYPVRDAWGRYQPANFPGSGYTPLLPEQARVVKDFLDDVGALVSREIGAREEELKAAVQRDRSPKSVNALGLLYARYDLAAKAEEQFMVILGTVEYVPALVNLGNLRFLRHNAEAALVFYERASRQAAHDPLVLLGLARSNHELQNYGLVRKQYEELRSLRPELANQFPYLQLQGEEATRSVEVTRVSDMVIWAEEK